jgi:hypothetical protein
VCFNWFEAYRVLFCLKTSIMIFMQ